MAADESLFSLEVFVEMVENICFSCYKPAIAFRFLDFPTVVIRPESEQLCRNETSLQIQSGKSCLFKMSKEMLGERLRSTPLYVMLTDISSGTTKLLASTTISMVNCFENILTNIEESGLDIPAVSGTKGEFHLYNLMGSHVGTVKLRYRMFSFGSGMSGHVNLSLSRKQGNKENVQSDSLLEQCEAKGSNIRNVRYETENNTTENKISDIPGLVTENIILRTDAGTQTENACAKRLNVVPIPQQKYINNYPDPSSAQPHGNISRPPPLYYNSIATFTKARVIPEHLVRTPKEEITSRLQYCDRSMQTCRPSHASSTNVLINMAQQQEDASTQCPSKYDLPLIEALLNELSLVKRKHGNNAEFSQQCNKDGMPPIKNKQIKIGSTTIVSSKRSQVQKNKIEKGPQNNFSKPKPTRASGKGVLIPRHPLKLKKSSLTYGTTKTQKLREAINKKSGCGEQNMQLRGCQFELALCEDKHEELLQEHNNMMQDGPMVIQKSKQIFREHKSTMTQSGETQLECKDIGVQVKIIEDHFDSTSQAQNQQNPESLLHRDGTTNILGATYIDDVIPASTVPMVTANPHKNIDQISASYSSLKEAEDISPNNAPFSNVSDAPSFSNVSPTVPLSRNNGSNSEKSSKESKNKSLSLDSRSSDKSLDLVNKPVGEILVDLSYSDNFDSDGSEQTGGDNDTS